MQGIQKLESQLEEPDISLLLSQVLSTPNLQYLESSRLTLMFTFPCKR